MFTLSLYFPHDIGPKTLSNYAVPMRALLDTKVNNVGKKYEEKNQTKEFLHLTTMNTRKEKRTV